MAIGTVKTKYGYISGEEYTGEYAGITVFRGVPYAKPPVGELRWKPPVEPEPWDGVKACVTFPPAAVQDFLTDRHAQEYYVYGTPEMSEDCLYLNICTPAQSAGESLPVFMWFHGGGLTNCHPSEPEFDPRELAKKGIIVITVGQRLSLFGYLSLPQLSAEQGGVSGNYGLMDQLLALDFVYNNIPAFGGDPERITVGGQSGGSTKCCVMASSPESKGRVKGVINQSGLKWYTKFPSMADAEQNGVEYLKYAGIDPDISLDELRKLDTFELFMKNAPRAIMPGEMVCDGKYVPCATLPEMFDKYLRGVNFLNGTNLGEAEIFAASEAKLGRHPVNGYVKKIGNARDFYAHFRNLLGDLYDEYGFESLVSVTDENAKFTAHKLANLGLCGNEGTNISRNNMLNRLFGAYYKKRSPANKAFAYLWTHMLPTSESFKGTMRDAAVALAWHSTEMWFTFASMKTIGPVTREWRDVDYRVADFMSAYWANFIKTGDPNGEGLPVWYAATDELGYQDLGDEPAAHRGLENKLDELIAAFVRKEFASLDI